jgi:hypothetical protein
MYVSRTCMSLQVHLACLGGELSKIPGVGGGSGAAAKGGAAAKSAKGKAGADKGGAGEGQQGACLCQTCWAVDENYHP